MLSMTLMADISDLAAKEEGWRAAVVLQWVPAGPQGLSRSVPCVGCFHFYVVGVCD